MQTNGRDITSLVRTITLYRSLRLEQVYRMFPDKKEKTIVTMIRQLAKDKRIIYDSKSQLIAASEDADEFPDFEMISAFWVLLDFWNEVQYHISGEYPVRISFYCNEDDYEIIFVSHNNELLVCHAMNLLKSNGAQRLVIVESTDQIPKIHIPDVVAFCIVSDEGAINYYKLQKNEAK